MERNRWYKDICMIAKLLAAASGGHNAFEQLLFHAFTPLFANIYLNENLKLSDQNRKDILKWIPVRANRKENIRRMTMGRIMITGALGNVGGYAAEYAIKNNAEVTVADINVAALQARYKERAAAVYFDFTKPDTFEKALDGVDRVFIMRPPHLGKPEDLQPFVDALKGKNIKLVAFLSLIGVEHNPFPPHGKIEKYIKAAKLSYCFIRPNFFMQNISGVHAFEIKHFDRIVVPVRRAVTGFIDAEDIGELTAKVLCEYEKHQNTAYAVTGPEAIDYRQVAQIMTKQLGRTITYADPKPSLAKKYWIEVRGLDKEYATVMDMLYMIIRMGNAQTVTTVFEEIMGKKPQSFEQFVIKNLDAWR